MFVTIMKQDRSSLTINLDKVKSFSETADGDAIAIFWDDGSVQKIKYSTYSEVQERLQELNEKSCKGAGQ